VRRAMAIQLVINKGMGLGKKRESEPGLVHRRGPDRSRRGSGAEGVRGVAERGGVLGAMETGYQRGKIQEDSMLYEHRKHDGSYPIIGVNTFRNRAETRSRRTGADPLERGRKNNLS